MKRQYLLFQGRVQGVGFRIRAQMAATKYHLTGYVRNRYDGDVEAEVQGEEYQIDAFLDEMKRQPWIMIENVICENRELKEENDFTIRYRMGG